MGKLLFFLPVTPSTQSHTRQALLLPNPCYQLTRFLIWPHKTSPYSSHFDRRWCWRHQSFWKSKLRLLPSFSPYIFQRDGVPLMNKFFYIILGIILLLLNVIACICIKNKKNKKKIQGKQHIQHIMVVYWRIFRKDGNGQNCYQWWWR